MPNQNINTIDDVINALNQIITSSEKDESPLGYFAALYLQVTLRVQEGIKNNEFQNGPRMEKLDVIFAKRYIDAYTFYQVGKPVTLSWLKAFGFSYNWRPIVLQHLLIGMNAHINLDLGIAAAEVSKGHDIEDLHHDFNKINEILASMVDQVEKDLTSIWRPLKSIIKWTKKADSFLIDFSMEKARDGAWKYAKSIAGLSGNDLQKMIQKRDQKVAKIANLIINPGLIINLLFFLIRLGERGSVSEKIKILTNKHTSSPS
ncbi:DUF5995 family protein [Aquimarina hainanensis]|uniref:DUF5995 family protein n=1 Tax=Aquimarina hainanensis TaxID=1578017 RepID=A0ABW5NBF4_9FLAO|nr:DUF5995 family protein [Aquimarina sp. TRL1]QKX06611.1 hypothetical protein HN014_17385 [Aquimarina sp. TRL1]